MYDTVGSVACPDCKGAARILFGVAEGLTKIVFYARCMTCHAQDIPATIRVTISLPKSVVCQAIQDGLPAKEAR